MIFGDRVQLAIASGVSVYCATCKHYWRGLAEERESCTAPGPCGSPLAGDTFSHYDGPITEAVRFCFVCGKQPSKLLKVGSKPRLIGVCEEHRLYLKTYKVESGTYVAPTVVLDTKGNKVEPKPITTLSGLMNHIAEEES
jgi:hypothetical protein